MLYTHTHVDVSRELIKHNDDFKRTHEHASLLKKYSSHTLFSKGFRKGWCWLCVRGELETGTDFYILTATSSDHSSTSFAFWLGCSTGGHWGLKASVWSWFSLRNLIFQEEVQLELQLTQTVRGTWLYNCLTTTSFLWACTSVPNSTTSTGQGDIPISSTGCTCFRPSTYLHRCISWLTTLLRANISY